MQTKHRIFHIIGLGAPAADGHLRITRGEHFDIVQGDEFAHERMTAFCLHVENVLIARGCRMEDLSQEELTALWAESET